MFCAQTPAIFQRNFSSKLALKHNNTLVGKRRHATRRIEREREREREQMPPPEEEKEEEKNNPWTCFGCDDSGDGSSGAARVTPTAETSEYFRLFTERVWGEKTREGTRTTLKTTREEEMRVLVDALEPELSKSKRGKRTWDSLKMFTIKGAKECALMVTEQKRLKDWNSFEWLFASAYAHVLILMKVVGDGTGNRSGLDAFEIEFASDDERVNVADDPRLPALLREWDSSVTKIARANLDLLNMVIGVDGEESLKKVPSFYGKLMREVEVFYEFHREKIEHSWGVKSDVVEIAMKIPEARQKKKSRDLVQNQIASELSDLSAAVFLQKYFKTQKPCVVRKYANEQKWKLLDLCKTTEFLRDEMFGGKRVVPVEFGFPGSNDSGAGVVSLSEFSEALNASNAVDASENSSSLQCKVAYVSQHCLFHHAPELQKYISIPHLTLGKVTSAGASNLWIGTRETRTSLHRDPYDNVFVQVSGFKYVRIYLDDQTEKLYSEAVMTTGAAGKNQVNAFTRSLVKDVENPDLKKFPKFAEATYFDTILNPGDAMFIPRGAWHYVRSLSTSISVNFWF